MLINNEVGAGALPIRFVAAVLLMFEKMGVTIVYQR